MSLVSKVSRKCVKYCTTHKRSSAIYVEGVEKIVNLWHLWHASICIVFNSMVGKCQVSAFQNFFQIENQLNIKKIMSKNVMSLIVYFEFFFDTYWQTYYHSLNNVFWASFDTLDIHSITVLTVYFELLSRHLTYIALQSLQCILRFFWHLQHTKPLINCSVFSTVFHTFNTSNI